MGARSALPRRLTLVTLAVGAFVTIGFACSSSHATDADAVTRTIDESGGAIVLGDVELTVPPGALAGPQTITVERTREPVPAGYVGRSAVYRFAPEGLVFAQPARLSMAVADAEDDLSIIWSEPGGTFAPLSTTLAAGHLTTSAPHFSEGFIGTPACEHASSCTVGARCTYFSARCEGSRSEKRNDCECDGAQWKCTVHESACGVPDAGGATDAGAGDAIDAGLDATVDAAPLDCGFPPFSSALTPLAAAKRPMNVVVDACYVYWTEQSGGGLWRVSKNGGAVTQLAVSTPPAGTTMLSEGLAIDSTSLYWSQYVSSASAGTDASILRSGDVVRTLVDGGASTKIWSGTNGPSAVAIDAQYAYVLQSSDLERVPLLGGAAVTLATGPGAYGLTVTPQRVLWTTYNSIDQVRSVPPSGGMDASTFAVGVGDAGTSSTVVVQDGTNVYWADTAPGAGSGHVYALPLSGGTQRVLYSGAIEPLGIAFDATSIYVSGGAGGQILRIAIATGDITVLASVQGWPYGIAVDDAFVYWANNNGGANAIMRIAK